VARFSVHPKINRSFDFTWFNSFGSYTPPKVLLFFGCAELVAQVRSSDLCSSKVFIVHLAAPSSPPVGGSVLLPLQKFSLSFFLCSSKERTKERAPKTPTDVFRFVYLPFRPSLRSKHRFTPFSGFPSHLESFGSGFSPLSLGRGEGGEVDLKWLQNTSPKMFCSLEFSLLTLTSPSSSRRCVPRFFVLRQRK
jgi:hypothetical protein